MYLNMLCENIYVALLKTFCFMKIIVIICVNIIMHLYRLYLCVLGRNSKLTLPLFPECWIKEVWVVVCICVCSHVYMFGYVHVCDCMKAYMCVHMCDYICVCYILIHICLQKTLITLFPTVPIPRLYGILFFLSKYASLKINLHI